MDDEYDKDREQHQPYIQSFPSLLKGHTKSVLCLDHSSKYVDNSDYNCDNTVGARGGLTVNSTLLSGSEDGTCRLWDLRCSIRASLCICVGNHYRSKNKLTTTTETSTTTTDVLSVSFGPKWNSRTSSNDTNISVQEEECVESSSSITNTQFAKDYSVYATIQNNVYGYDLRYIKSPIITIPSMDYSTILQCTDEINQIAATWSSSSPSPVRTIHHHQQQQQGRHKTPSTKRNTTINNNNTVNSISNCSYLASADDSGMVRIIDTIQRVDNDRSDGKSTSHRIYVHDESALVTSLAFTPSNSRSGGGKQRQQQPVLLVSGGTDCCINLWDVTASFRQTSKRTKQQQQQQQNNALAATTTTTPICSISIPTQSSNDNTNQVCNPPMVHCLQYSPSGKLLVGGLGDGSIVIMHQTNTTLVLSSRLYEAYSGTVASCLFPAWTSNNQQQHEQQTRNHAITAHDRLLCTVGNDGCIVLWDLGSTIAGEKASNPRNLFPINDDDNDLDNSKMLQSTKTFKGEKKRPDSDRIIVDEPKTLFAFQHPLKPNWMVNSGSCDSSYPYSLFVADTSNDISIYTIPVQ